MKIKAVDYKGKHFILYDEDRLDDEMDDIINYIDVDTVITTDLADHVSSCMYYGIPAYVGSNEELKKEIERLYIELDKKE